MFRVILFQISARPLLCKTPHFVLLLMHELGFELLLREHGRPVNGVSSAVVYIFYYEFHTAKIEDNILCLDPHRSCIGLDSIHSSRLLDEVARLKQIE